MKLVAGWKLYLAVALASALLVTLGVVWHSRTVAHALGESYKRGQRDLESEINRQARDLEAAAVRLRLNAEQLQRVANTELGEANAKAVDDLGRRADRLLQSRSLRECQPGPGVGRLSDLPRPSLAAVAQGLLDDRVVGVPERPLIGFAKSHDGCFLALGVWEKWYDRQLAIYQDWKRQAEEAAVRRAQAGSRAGSQSPAR